MATWAFGTFTLDDGGTSYLVTEAFPPAAPVETSRLPFAVREGSAAVQRRGAENSIKVKGIVRSTVSYAQAEANLDALILALNSGVQALSIGYQDGRYWLAVLDGKPTIAKDNGFVYEYEADFIIVDPYAYAASASQLAPGPAALTLT